MAEVLHDVAREVVYRCSDRLRALVAPARQMHAVEQVDEPSVIPIDNRNAETEVFVSIHYKHALLLTGARQARMSWRRRFCPEGTHGIRLRRAGTGRDRRGPSSCPYQAA